MSSYSSEIRVLHYGTLAVAEHPEDVAKKLDSGREARVLVEFTETFISFSGDGAERHTRVVFVNPDQVQFVRAQQ